MKRIYARNTTIKQITWKEAQTFLDSYHIQKSIQSEVYYGLYFEGELVQVETFGLPRIELQSKHINHDWELLRECSKKDYYIIGGKSKLLKAFERDYKPLALLSYCNVTEGFDGHSYKECGFNLDRTSEDYYYEYNGELIKRYKMQKNSNLRKNGITEPIEKTLKSFGKEYDCNLTEAENAKKAGFKTIVGKGQQVWSKYYSEDIGYIYEITCIENGKTYIGQHTLRKNGKLGKINYFGSGVYLQRAIDKHGKKAFKIKVLEWTNDLSKLTELEYKYISEAKANGKAEYNVATNPYNASGHHYQNKTPSNSESMKEYYKTHKSANFGKKATIEARIKMSESHLGKKMPPRTQEHIDKIKQSEGYKNRDKSNKNHSYDDEIKSKISEGTKIAMKRVKQDATEYIHNMGYFTVEDLMKIHNLGMRSIMRKYKKVGKYKMMTYYEDSLK